MRRLGRLHLAGGLIPTTGYGTRLGSSATRTTILLVLALEPFAGDFDEPVCSFHSYWPDEGRAVSTVNALITLWLASGSDSPDELAGAYDTCLEIATLGFGPPRRDPGRFRILVLRQLAADQHRVPRIWLESVPSNDKRESRRS